MVDLSNFIGQLFSQVANLFVQYLDLLKSIVLFKYVGADETYTVTAFGLRIGVLFLQIFFGLVFVLAPRLGSGSVMKGNGV